MAKRSPLSTGKENSKCFDFVFNDNDFEEHTRGFVPATTAADTQKCIKLFEDWKKKRNSTAFVFVASVPDLYLPLLYLRSCQHAVLFYWVACWNHLRRCWVT